MTKFLRHGRVYYSSVEFAMEKIGGTWKIPILVALKSKVMRYTELKIRIRHISDKMLSAELKSLEASGFLCRKAYPTVPPKVEYSLSALGKSALPVIEVLSEYGLYLMSQEDQVIKYCDPPS